MRITVQVLSDRTFLHDLRWWTSKTHWSPNLLVDVEYVSGQDIYVRVINIAGIVHTSSQVSHIDIYGCNAIYRAPLTSSLTYALTIAQNRKIASEQRVNSCTSSSSHTLSRVPQGPRPPTPKSTYVGVRGLPFNICHLSGHPLPHLSNFSVYVTSLFYYTEQWQVWLLPFFLGSRQPNKVAE